MIRAAPGFGLQNRGCQNGISVKLSSGRLAEPVKRALYPASLVRKVRLNGKCNFTNLECNGQNRCVFMMRVEN